MTPIDSDARLHTPELGQPTGDWTPLGPADGAAGSLLAERVRRLRQLAPAWDGESAVPIRADVIDAVCDFIRSVPAHMTGVIELAAAVPIPNGSVELEWARGQRILQFEFENPQSIHYMRWDSDDRVRDEGFFPADDATTAESMLRWFQGS